MFQHFLRFILVPFVGISSCLLFCLRVRFSNIRQASRRKQIRGSHDKRSNKKPLLIGFFHPNCSAGGGGERVLWSAIAVLGKLCDRGVEVGVIIYTTDDIGDEGMDGYEKRVFDHVLSRFSINVPTALSIRFVHVKKIQQGPRSMIGQSFDSMKLAYRSLIVATPDVFFDTTGCAFTFIIAKIVAGCKVAAYVHYPTISTDMLQLVWERRPTYNNDNAIVASPLKSYLKMMYYVCFAVCYGLVGSLSDLVLTNSTWTCNHIRSLWRMAKSIIIIFPPCDTQSLVILPIQNRQKYIMSIGQFRPEKDHMLQMKAFSLLAKNNNFKDVKLLLIGSCRGSGDESRVQELKALSKSLSIEDRVEFVVNQPFLVLKKWFGIASVGLHTMWNEHFGIGVVEMMAAGLITIAHNSGGPKSDIILSGKTGYLASTAEEYANAMKAVFSKDKNDEQFLQMREKGRASAQRFSDDVFATSLEKILLESNILQRY